MKIALLCDSHLGSRNDSMLFHEYFKKFYDTVFFPEIEARNITTVVHLGDLFDRRKYINFNLLYESRTGILENPTSKKLDWHVLVGNHDCYHRDSNEVNSVRELCNHYSNWKVYEKPEEVLLGNLRVLFVPWLNPTILADGLETIANSTSKVLMGHLEIAGFHMDQSQVSEHGLNRDIFAKFKQVFSGHFHHKSEEGPIKYLGAPYEMTFADLNDPKGFHIFDTETLELEYIVNPHFMFNRLIYDDREPKVQKKLIKQDLTQYKDTFVRVIATHKTNPALYEKWLDKLYKVTENVTITDYYEMQMSADELDDIGKEIKLFEIDPTQHQTVNVINKYIDNVGLDIDLDKLKTVMTELYAEATILSGNVND